MEKYLQLEDEFGMLQIKFKQIEQFILSNEYETISEEEQSYLFIQKESMKTYGSCLVARMKLEMRKAL